ncbi:uncharacterized protein LOC101861656 [Aplysia californica]|uniref:Palmitoyltransferase n=1 Tax=Aplysia californica TaxID=6500 RepID=A0ABM0ZYH0_APLCA|nr:uncharacterized protein LOC101861656 [Aplysia californica]
MNLTVDEEFLKLSFREKWARHREDQKTQGIMFHADWLNRWVPIYWFFVLSGGVGWLSFATIPAHHSREPFWLFANEVFIWFLFIQIMINWTLVRTTSSRYEPHIHSKMTSTDTTPLRSGSDVRDKASSSDVTQAETITISLDNNNDAEGVDNSSSNDLDNDEVDAEPTNETFKMLVATAVNEGRVERKSFPYWSWVPCLMCQRPRPPRCHHCTVCKECVLKRDHHCYFTRTCIGVNNQRYFLFYLFWAVQIASHAFLELIPYYLRRVLPETSVWDLFLPFNVYHLLTGQLSLTNLYFIAIFWGVACIAPVTIGMFSMTLFLSLRGLTKFEFDHGIKVKDTRSIPARLRSVLGRNWGLALLSPLTHSSPLSEDAVNWPYIKVL